MKISDSIKYAGYDDTELELFESQYPTEGISYNSYVILDEKTAIMDTVDARGTEAYFENLKEILGERSPSYLVIQHMEPDHAANIGKLADMYPEMEILGSAAAGKMLVQFFDEGMKERFRAVKENDTVTLGKHTLRFFMAPMVHWPEVMVTYEESEKVLFSADAFGTFGALANNEEWIADASHYYFNIVGKYGAQVQALLKKVKALDVEVIASLHGPVHKDDIGSVIETYDKWSRYEPDRKGIFIPFASIHGNTKKAILEFAETLKASGETVVTMDLTKEDVSEAVEQAFLYDRVIFASSTYDLEIFPPMNDLLHHLKIKNYQNRKVGIVENGSWSPAAAKKIREYLEGMKDITIVDPVITIRSTRKPENDADFDALAAAMKS
ncbi:MAG: MBL fold metallo-hydrolase [Lachnospiraceae bacterium]|nr:MBL fold metallo-hydrolase [Lachnospiraceae bacterium]